MPGQVSGRGVFLAPFPQVRTPVKTARLRRYSVGEKTFGFANTGDSDLTVSVLDRVAMQPCGSVPAKPSRQRTWIQVPIRCSPEPSADQEPGC